MRAEQQYMWPVKPQLFAILVINQTLCKVFHSRAEIGHRIVTHAVGNMYNIHTSTVLKEYADKLIRCDVIGNTQQIAVFFKLEKVGG